MRSPLKFSDIERGLNPEAETLAAALWATGQINEDIAYSLAQHAASTNAARLTPELLLLCVLSDVLGRKVKKSPKECEAFLGFITQG